MSLHQIQTKPLCLIAGALLMLLSSCQPAKSPSTNSNSAVQTNSSSDPQYVGRPLLSGVIKNVSLYPVPGQKDNLAISLVVSVENTGSTSLASGWRLDVSSTNVAGTSSLEPVRVNGVVDLPGTTKSVDLAKEDLAIKTAENPISKGNPVEGVLTFVLPQANERDLAKNNTGLVLHFKDAVGNSYQTAKAVVGSKLGVK